MKKILPIIILGLLVVGAMAYKLPKPAEPRETTTPAGPRTYRNPELGIAFQYPESWGTAIATLDDYTTTKDENIEEFQGRAISVRFALNKTVWVKAASSDYWMYADISYKGGEDLTSLCKSPDVKDGA